MRKKRSIARLMTLAAMTSALVGVSAPASAAAPCDPNVGFTIKDGNYIKGSGSLPCSGTARVTLQRTILGVWGKDLTSVELSGAGASRSVVWNCQGSGRYTYRTYITWRTIGGKPGFKQSNHLEVNC
jgi:ABC-type protease/lipase transport system fused ATPase/permease subunit